MHLYMTILLGLKQLTAFAANLLQRRGGSRNPITFKMELCNNCEWLKAVNHYHKVPHFSYEKVHKSVSDN